MLYGDATYKAKLSNIMVKTGGGYVDFGDYLQMASATVQTYQNGLDRSSRHRTV